MRSKLELAMITAGLTLATQAAAQLTSCQHEEVRGGSYRPAVGR